jgi:hypothetical protein
MQIVSSYIEFEKYYFDYLTEVEIVSSWKQLTDTATIKFPRLYNVESRKIKLDQQIKYGEKVTLQLGYDFELVKVFEGFVTGIKPVAPVEIRCEDKMFELKRKQVKPKGWKNAHITDILKYIGIAKYETLGDIVIGPFCFDSTTRNAAQALDKLKDIIKLPIFFRAGVLMVGNPYNPDTTKVTKTTLTFGYDIVTHSLEYKRKEDTMLKIKAVSHLPNGKKIELELGDSDGEARTLDFYNLDKATLKKRAEAQIELLKYDGWRGSITTYGEPFMHHGDIVVLVDPEEEKQGQYYIDEVKTTTSATGGYRHELKLGAKAA